MLSALEEKMLTAVRTVDVMWIAEFKGKQWSEGKEREFALQSGSKLPKGLHGLFRKGVRDALIHISHEGLIWFDVCKSQKEQELKAIGSHTVCLFSKTGSKTGSKACSESG